MVAKVTNMTDEAAAPAPIEPKPFKRPAQIQLQTVLYYYDLRQRHQFDMQETLRRFRSRPLKAEVKDDVGQVMIGQTVPDSVQIDGPHIIGYIVLNLEPQHQIKKLCGVENDVRYDPVTNTVDLTKE